MSLQDSDNDWDIIIHPEIKLTTFHWKELWHYRYLISTFVKRDFIVFYKQTILGPLWYLIQPLLTTVVFTIIFGKVAKIPTDNIPPFLFYLSGIVIWNYFSSCFSQTSNTFFKNARIFSIIYFPRLTVPIATVFINLVQLAIQMLLFLGFYLYFFCKNAPIHPNLSIIGFPIMILQMALLGLGFGLLITSLTTKYRDLAFVIGFTTQLWMFASPIIYPASLVNPEFLNLYMLNPIAPVIEQFRFAFLGNGIINPLYTGISWVITIIILWSGLLLFNKTEKNAMDVV